MTFLTGEVEVGLGRGTTGWREEKPTEGCGLKIKLGVCYRFIDVNGVCSRNSHVLS